MFDHKAIESMEEKDYFVPAHLRNQILQYIQDGVKPNEYLSAILRNDLCTAVELMTTTIPEKDLITTTRWLIRYMPKRSFGTENIFFAWRQMGGLNGIEKVNNYKKTTTAS